MPMASSALPGRSNRVGHCAPEPLLAAQLPFRCLWDGGSQSGWGIKAASPLGLGNRRLCLSFKSAFSGAPHHALHQLSPLSKRRGDKRQCVRFIPPPGRAQISLLSAKDQRHHFRKGRCSARSVGRFCAGSFPRLCRGFPGPVLGSRQADARFLMRNPHPAPREVASLWVAGDPWPFGKDEVCMGPNSAEQCHAALGRPRTLCLKQNCN